MKGSELEKIIKERAGIFEQLKTLAWLDCNE